MSRFKLLAAIHPLLILNPAKQKILEEIEQVVAWYKLLYLEPSPRPWVVYMLGLCAGFNDSQVQVLVRRLSLTKKEANLLVELRHAVKRTVESLFVWEQQQGSASEFFFILEPLGLEGILYLMARSSKETMRKQISLYLTQLRTQSIDITGKDLQHLGIAPGPIYGRILKQVTAAKLDNGALTRDEQLKMAAEMAKHTNPPPANRGTP
jgi:tRNA nucleotidyltransferase (CCA-adding enzyme)